ncbi:PD40 domain-containing protein [Candidatus Poribacteria bacterium]|nr:PD40 domain-containing protein [Candidatus Poribacteria bacterium]
MIRKMTYKTSLIWLVFLLNSMPGFPSPWLEGKLAFVRKEGPSEKICVLEQGKIHTIFSVVNDGRAIGEISWSPNGREIVFNLFECVNFSCSKSTLYIINSLGGMPRRLEIKGDYKFISFHSPDWSPRGDKIAFIGIFEGKRENVAGALDAVFTVKTDGTELREMGWDKETWFMRSLCWASDGRRIIFSRQPFGKPGQVSLDLFIIDTVTGEKRQLTQTKMVSEDHPSCSPDGKRIAYSASGLNEGLFIMDLENGNRTEVPLQGDLKKTVSRSTWSKDGNQIIFSARGDLYLYDLKTRNLKKLLTGLRRSSFDWWGGYTAVKPLNLLNTFWSLIKRGEIK